jgi:hypothetical protein
LESARFEHEGYAVVAVALAGGTGTIAEDVTLVAAATAAVVFAARHDQFEVQLGGDGLG